MRQLKDQKVVEEKETISVSMRCFLFSYDLPRRIPFATRSQYEASAAPMTSKNNNRICDERCIDMLMVVSSEL